VGNLTPEQWKHVTQLDVEGLRQAIADATPPPTEGEQLAQATQRGEDEEVDDQNPRGGVINKITPPPDVLASRENQPPQAPPQPLAASYNPINKYGVYLPETKGPLQK